MAKAMKWTAVICFLMTALFAVIYRAGFHWATPFAITFGTCFYHFAMRLLVGQILNHTMGNKADYTKHWYQLRPFEIRLYKALKVKKWKSSMPTFDPSLFDPKLHSWEEIAQAMCQAEVVHEIIVVLSFLPLFAALPFGAFFVFLVTSLLAALFDLSFVIIQRFNRSRVLTCLQRSQSVTSNRRNKDEQMEP